jgi:hypothetical protein
MDGTLFVALNKNINNRDKQLPCPLSFFVGQWHVLDSHEFLSFDFSVWKFVHLLKPLASTARANGDDQTTTGRELIDKL